MGSLQSAPIQRARPRLLGALCCLAMLLSVLSPQHAEAESIALPDFPIPNGHFYTQASGRGGAYGFQITDGDGANFNSEFIRLGGVAHLGFPASERFVFGGFITQATQKTLLQWRPETRRVAFVNVFDVFTQRGLDPVLAKTRLIPPTADNSADSGLSWPQVVARHLAILNQNAAIKARYFADPDPIDDFGLPQGSADFGGVFVIRCQRAAFQQWRVKTSFARAGDVTQVNAGDLAKEFGLVPDAAATPASASDQVVAPLGQEIRLDSETVAAAKRAAAAARPALVRIDVVTTDSTGVASGIVMDRSGDILTNAHVVADAMLIRVTFANNVTLTATVAGVDPEDDVAVLRVDAASIGSGVAPASIADGARLQPGQRVTALGFTPFFPSSPAIRLGVYQTSLPTSPSILRSDLYILPGDSGGMLLDLSGNVVGVNDEIRFTREPQQPLISLSIDATDAMQIARRLLQGR